MKKLLVISLSLVAVSLLSISALSGQIDSSRQNEVRFSFLGVQPYSINIPGYFEQFNSRYADLSFAYLRKLKNQERLYLKTEISGRRLAVVDFDQRSEEKIADGRLDYINVFLGLERQTQFRHFGLFLAGGIIGGYANYTSDFKPIELNPVRDYQNNFRSIGLAAQATAFTNISDNIYIYLTLTSLVHYENVSYNQVLDDCCEDGSGLDTKLLYIDAVGVAYKF